jgi:hypothetical protein
MTRHPDEWPRFGGAFSYGWPVPPVRYLSRAEVAQRIGVKPDSLSRLDLPEPEVIVGTVRGWSAKRIDAWDARRERRLSTRRDQRS